MGAALSFYWAVLKRMVPDAWAARIPLSIALIANSVGFGSYAEFPYWVPWSVLGLTLVLAFLRSNFLEYRLVADRVTGGVIVRVLREPSIGMPDLPDPEATERAIRQSRRGMTPVAGSCRGPFPAR